MSDKHDKCVSTSNMNCLHGSSKTLGWYCFVTMLLEMLNLTCIFVRNDQPSQISEVLYPLHIAISGS